MKKAVLLPVEAERFFAGENKGKANGSKRKRDGFLPKMRMESVEKALTGVQIFLAYQGAIAYTITVKKPGKNSLDAESYTIPI